ncbi:AAA family ATPase [Microbacterium esteraromaticum]|uniref:AAA family ATPase n=1 Tax=Microbacterium esteraromaticum TaxID=57043 RepID=A0A939DTW3_9MICO|nr:DUF3696 domain-containing protein [Microbacterium esteraromaticum]MBN8205105.1 AAA family ATPase [Microbacterium esteraromaticum]MBN8415259.1 AAA family ATPase [Microbacterium esteraromaticum]
MLWQVNDFKGVRSAQLDTRSGKTTILTGINSSGKSSIIQSLLLLAQSLHSEGPLVLNGPLVRLGEATDLVREASGGNAITINMELKAERNEELLHGRELQATFSLSPKPDGSTLTPTRIEIIPGDNATPPLVLEHAHSRTGDRNRAEDLLRGIGTVDALRLKSMIDGAPDLLRTYVILQGLRPIGVIQFKQPDSLRDSYRRAIQAVLDGRQQAASKKSSNTSSSRVAGATLINEFVRHASRAAGRSKDHPARALLEEHGFSRGTMPPHLLDRMWGRLSLREKDLLLDAAAQERQRRDFIFLPVRGSLWGHGSVADGLLEGILEVTLGDTYVALQAVENAMEALGERVQYLGPLRDEPRVVWNHWNEIAKGLPVGTRGEYSAAVLSRAQTTLVPYRSSDGEDQVRSLNTAVDHWLSYLKIGETVSARSHGKLGVGLDLIVDGHTRDLTSVGVGVSQALPLVVGVLAAPRDAIFIIEQPELHLHPAVQARLADFLITARPDMSIIIETHSDAFVTRIRRRVAEDQVAPDSVDIIFVEPGDGGSTARTLNVTEFGDLTEWPSGFLSSAEEDVRAILMANIARSTAS